MKHLFAAAIATALATPAFAASTVPVDLTGWEEDGYKGSAGAGTWTVQSGNDSVVQSINGQPTVFFKPGDNAQGTALAGTIEVQTTGDDDFVGFVLGYQDNEFNSTNADFWLIDWKQGDQSPAIDGLALSHVTGDITSSVDNDFWQHVGVVSEKERGASLGSTGWADNTIYNFELIFTSSLIEVKVNGTTEISFTQAENGGQSFTDGAFGFYNYSQDSVEYAGITTAPAPAVPVPASLPLLAAGFGAMALMRRTRKAG